MDTFFEQIVTIKVEGKKLAGLILSWVIALLACIGIIVLSMFVPMVMMVIIIAIVGILMGTYKLCQKFFIEYEYIVTNNSLDIDTIIARNNRKRLITIDIPNAVSLSFIFSESFTRFSYQLSGAPPAHPDIFIIHSHA